MSKALKNFFKYATVDEMIDKAKKTLSFRSEVMDMLQVSKANKKIPGVPRIQAYRYPSPASREAPNIPSTPSYRIYSIMRYPTDHRLMKREEKVILAKRVEAYGKTETDNIGQSLLPSGEDAKKGSPGNKNPAVLKYDPTGLRSSMSATWAELDKSLELHKPLHLPTAEWVDDYPAMLEHAKKHNLPEPIGRPLRMMYQKLLRTAHW